MYQALLTRRYLTTKVMPLLAIVAVMLCTAMVLIVWSIMGGFLTMLLNSGRTLMGDVAISWPTSGFAYYDDLIERLEADPAVAAATPVIESFGTLSLPDGRIEGLQIKGIHGPSYGRVTGYTDSLWWRPIDEPLPRDTRYKDHVILASGEAYSGRIVKESEGSIRFRIESEKGRARTRTFSREEIAQLGRGVWQDIRLRNHDVWARHLDNGLHLREVDERTGVERPAMVIGIEVTGFNERTEGGVYIPRPFGVRTETGEVLWRNDRMIDSSLLVTLYPQGRSGRPVDVVSRILPVANEFRSGVYEIDSSVAYVNLDELQRMLRMDAAPRLEVGQGEYDVSIDPETGEERFETPEVQRVDPPRVTTVLVRAADGVTPDRLAAVARRIYAEFAAAHPGEVPAPPPDAGRAPPDSIIIQTWEQRQGTMVAAIKKETGLVMFIIMFISMVASFLILAIFWAMVSEKTKDIGVLRALGAGKLGVAWLWLRYGLAIGLIGSVLGGIMAHLIVWNINPIHEWIGRNMGLYIWDPKVYYFTEIPHEVEPWKAAIVLVGGLTFSILGALIPAVKAANMDPVQALRFE